MKITLHPRYKKKLLTEFHPTLNGELKLSDFTHGSDKKVWWKCNLEHEWMASISNRVNGRDCRLCKRKRPRKVIPSNCLSFTHPEIAKQWHPTKNLPLTPRDVSFGMRKKVWWKCPIADDHEWEASLNSRSNIGSGCPCCAGVKTIPSNCLSFTHPEIAKQWHPTKNGKLTPCDVTFGSHKKVWWKCPIADDHEWQTIISNRTNGNGCPCCYGGLKVALSNCLATIHPYICKYWHPTKNLHLTPYDVTAGSGKKVWWKCDKVSDHEWEAPIHTRTDKRLKGGIGCPCCYGQTVVLSNCLATTHQELIKEWHPIKNLPLTPFDITFGSAKKVWWKCDKSDDHEWKTSIGNRTKHNGNGCPCCAGLKVVLSNCLATTHPELASQWHPTKNGNLTAFDVVAGSSRKKVWWKCEVADDHEWEASINPRVREVREFGCSCCDGKTVVLSNCLLTTNPEIAKQWHPTKNLPLTPRDVTSGSNKKVWWKCPVADNHEWKTVIGSRVRTRTGCPFCSESHGEKRIKNILEEMGLEYESQKKFDGCKYKNKLPFDLYLPQYNVLIEYDGMQHFEPNDFFGGIEEFKITQKRDAIKTAFAAKNNIPLLRIPYTKFDRIEKEVKAFIATFHNQLELTDNMA